jgi:hypothetical protein
MEYFSESIAEFADSTLQGKKLYQDDLHLASVSVAENIISSTPKHHDRVPGIAK